MAHQYFEMVVQPNIHCSKLPKSTCREHHWLFVKSRFLPKYIFWKFDRSNKSYFYLFLLLSYSYSWGPHSLTSFTQFQLYTLRVNLSSCRGIALFDSHTKAWLAQYSIIFLAFCSGRACGHHDFVPLFSGAFLWILVA